MAQTTLKFTELMEKWQQEDEKKNVLKSLGLHCQKVCTNSFRAFDYKMVDGKNTKVPMLYRRSDLTEWAQEAFDEGNYCFYCEPVNPDDPNGALRKCEPKYVYKVNAELSCEEYEQLVATLQTLTQNQKGE